MTLIAEDLLLLLLDDESGRQLASSYTDQALGGALLIELALAGAVEIHREGRLSRTRARATGTPLCDADPLLTTALATVAEKERPPRDLVGRLGKGVRPVLLDRLEQRGVLTREEDRVLGLFPRTRWPAAQSAQEDAVRRQLVAALTAGQDPDERTGALAALLSAVDVAHKVVKVEEVPARDIRKRAKELSEGAWAAEAVREVIQATTTLVIAATAGAVAAGSS